METKLAIDDKVTCLHGSIDEKFGKGSTGQITGFARFSSYHPREVMVSFEDGRSGWFWERDVQPVAASIDHLEDDEEPRGTTPGCPNFRGNC